MRLGFEIGPRALFGEPAIPWLRAVSFFRLALSHFLDARSRIDRQNGPAPPQHLHQRGEKKKGTEERRGCPPRGCTPANCRPGPGRSDQARSGAAGPSTRRSSFFLDVGFLPTHGLGHRWQTIPSGEGFASWFAGLSKHRPWPVPAVRTEVGPTDVGQMARGEGWRPKHPQAVVRGNRSSAIGQTPAVAQGSRPMLLGRPFVVRPRHLIALLAGACAAGSR